MDWWEVVWATGAKIHLSPTLGKSLKGSLEGFPGGPDGKESACSAGDPGSIPKSGGSRGDPPVGCMATHSSILAWRILWTEEPGGLHGVTKNWTRLSDYYYYKWVNFTGRLH